MTAYLQCSSGAAFLPSSGINNGSGRYWRKKTFDSIIALYITVYSQNIYRRPIHCLMNCTKYFHLCLYISKSNLLNHLDFLLH